MIYEPEDLMMMIPRRLEEAMKYKGFTPTQLSRVAQVDVDSIFRILSGNALPRLDTLTKMCNALDVSPNFMVSWEKRRLCDDCDAAGYEDGELFPTYCRIVNDTVTYIHRGRCPFKDNIVVNKGSEFEWRESLGDNYAE